MSEEGIPVNKPKKGGAGLIVILILVVIAIVVFFLFFNKTSPEPEPTPGLNDSDLSEIDNAYDSTLTNDSLFSDTMFNENTDDYFVEVGEFLD